MRRIIVSDNNNATTTSSSDIKLSVSEKICYGLGNTSA